MNTKQLCNIDNTNCSNLSLNPISIKEEYRKEWHIIKKTYLNIVKIKTLSI